MSVLIDETLRQKAEKLGINISKTCEIALKNRIQALEQLENPNNHFSEGFSTEKSSVVGPPGFEPGSIAPEAEFWVGFRGWLQAKKYSKAWESTLFNQAQTFYSCLASGNLDKIRDLPKTKQPNALKGLSALAKFSGKYEDFGGLVKNYRLPWGGTSSDDIVINRLVNISNPGEIWEWVKSVKEGLPGLSCFMDFMSYTGLRYIEALHSYELIRRLGSSGKLLLVREGKNYSGGYYNRELSTLEHFWFKDIFLRNSKKAFISFVPSELVDRIVGSAALVDPSREVMRWGLKRRFGDVREMHGSFFVKFLRESEINFLHGRVTSSVFMSNYFNPVVIGDLRGRVFQGIGEIQEKIKT